MRQGAILAIDQGTTNTKALLVGLNGEILVGSSVPLTQKYPQAGWVEQDLAEIWQSVEKAIDVCLSEAENIEIKAVAISNQRETAAIWHRQTGKPLGPAIGWQCRRTADFCEDLRAKKLEEVLQEKTGLNLDPLFSGTKFRWLIENLENAKDEIFLGNIDAWLLWNL
ncbi:MAG TPA: FGGY family carbohydrate kinase, partial [Pyrinomonadaceae bacterium]|nr:FGGY family carbohydrate kinase [Pyrinomonadaceae bacterium]